MRNYLLIGLFAILITSVNAQSIYYFTVLNAQNDETVPFVQIWFKNHEIGCCTDEFGSGILRLNEQLLPELFLDSIVFQALSYESQLTTLGTFTPGNNHIVRLEPRPLNLSEVEIIIKKRSKTQKIGNSNYKWSPDFVPKSNYGAIGWIIGRYIPNNSGRNPIIKSVSFYIENEGYYQAPFRVRIFSVNDSHWPDKDLLHTNVIVYAKKAGSWLQIDISKYNIRLPDSGVVVAMEWIWTGDQYYYSAYETKNYGPTLGFTMSTENYFRMGIYKSEIEWRYGRSYGISSKQTFYNDPLIYIRIVKK